MTEKETIFLGEIATTELNEQLEKTDKAVLLWPVGSTEPHGPHLPLATDIILSKRNAVDAAIELRRAGVYTLVAPDLPYGVTEFAAGFSGAITVPEDTLVDFLSAAMSSFLDNGFAHVCLINHHLEPGQLNALQRAKRRVNEARGEGHASVPLVIDRRWGRHLGDEFRSGACHAGEYEGSLILAATPELFRHEAAKQLPDVDISLSTAIKAGKTSFLEAGADSAYTGTPSTATRDEGERLYSVLRSMVVTEVQEHLEQIR
mgnify:CR=1 FL=1